MKKLLTLPVRSRFVLPLFFSLGLLFGAENASATTYYSTVAFGSGIDVINVNNWSNTYQVQPTFYGGTGISPTDFTSAADEFHIMDGDAMVASALWTIAGKLVVTSTSDFDASGFNHSIKVDIQSGGLYHVNSLYSSLVFGIISTAAEFHIYGTYSIIDVTKTYPNLFLDGSGTVSPAGTLNVNGNLTINGKIYNVSTIVARIVNIGGNLEIQAGTFRGANNTASSTINITGNLNISGGTLVCTNSSGSPTFNVSGDFNHSLGTFQGVSNIASGNPTINLSGNFNQTGGSYSALVTGGTGRIKFAMSGLGKTINAATQSNDQHKFKINSTTGMASNFSLSDSLTIGASGNLSINNFTLTLKGGLVNSGTLTGGITSNIIFNSSTVSASLPAITLGGLTINSTGQIITMIGSVSVNTVTLTSGTLSIGANTLTLNSTISGSGTLAGGVTSNINIGSAATGLSLPAVTLNNLTVGVTSSIGGAVTVNGALTLTSGSFNNTSFILTMGNGATINVVSGSLTAAPTFGTSVNLTYTGLSNTTTGFEVPSSSTILNNVTFGKTGTVTLASNLAANGILTISSGILNTDATSSFGVDVKGNWINNGTYTANNNTTTFSGTTTISGSGTQSFSGITISGTLTAPSALTVTGNFTNNGIFTHSSGTVTLSGSSSSNLAGTKKTTFSNLILSKTSGGITITSDTVSIVQLVSITSGTLATNNKLVLTATADNVYASLLDASTVTPNGSVTGTIVFHRILNARGGTATNGNAAMYSSPFSDGTVSIFQPNTTNFYFLNASTASYTKATSIGQSLTPSVGFSRRGAKFGESDYLIGSPSNGNVSATLVTSASGSYNLVGNPYPSTLAWGSVTKSNLGGSGTAYLYNGVSFNAITSGNISVAQGFQVLALTGASLTFTNSARNSTGTSFLRVEDIEQKLSIHLKGLTGYKDESFILLDQYAKDQFDVHIDAPKLFHTNTDCPSLALLKDSSRTVIYHLNGNQIEKSIPIYSKVKTNGSYPISIEGTEYFTGANGLYLKDTKNNTLKAITADILDYPIEINTTDTLRYHLVVNAGTVTSLTDDNLNTNTITCYAKNKSVFINNMTKETIKNVTIFNISGTKIYEGEYNGTGIRLNSSSTGVYVAKIETGNSLQTRKFILE